MSTVQSVSSAVDKVQKARKIWVIVSSTAFPYILIALILLFIGALVILLLFFPFLLFADEDNLSWETESGDGYEWMTPVQMDADGSAYFWPVPSIDRITSSFGYRDLDGMEFHKGIDIAAGAGKTELQPVYAMADGQVTLAGSASGYGYAIYIDHGNGLVTKYGHLDSKMDVSVGDTVKKGQRIGRIGAGIVGRSTGPHLHFQVEVNGKPVDPLSYIQEPGAAVPVELSYRALNIPAVQKFLEKRNSALATEDILVMIDAAGKKTNVDPHLLLAITGQEQSFVPKNNNHASEIIKNPWNVFGCWCSGKGATLNTEESAMIAAKTIVKLSQDRPEGRNPIEWLSAKDNPRGYYAEHNGWWIGVSKFYKALLETGGG
ncbi:M23 family metallopeptidase [Paenibacillus macerans]|uniref:Peptidase M23 family protein n=1 Tax=Paenibacillus macerans TaxID=44252 RepID=A0A090Y3Q8_PAEMA|nr:M23 family metallopeptidase [Paenibacillus macerans]KFM93049.1 peptidase M23 family protein [Paenibacillus macerans]MCY7558560.1 M23 family metallopeptidase [Paenibacillus macerans]MEC0153932.1 M23 family metallopeptidase [Paenibacillus macerans]SUA84797.1 peptidase M23 [Paenibacillus macerans]